MKELFDKLNAEYAGGRAVAVVDGKKQYLTDVGADGQLYLNELGLRLQEELAATPKVETKPKKAKKEVVETPAVTDEIELDI